MAAPGTSPPPSTRSSSGTPLLRNDAESTDTCAIGTAALVTGPASDRLTRGAAGPRARSPALALPPPPAPLRGGPAALGAQVRRARSLRHGSHARRHHRQRPAT